MIFFKERLDKLKINHAKEKVQEYFKNKVLKNY